MSLLIVGLDTTIVNVALPSIHRSLHASRVGSAMDDRRLHADDRESADAGGLDRRPGRAQARVHDRAGRVHARLGACARSLRASATLIAARVLQAIGGSMLNPVAMSIIRNVFEDPRERAQAVGIWGAMIGISMSLGPIVGGALVDGAGWRWVFVINLPVGLLALALTALFVPESRAEHARRLDPVGQVLVIAALASLTYAIIEGPRARLDLGRDPRPVQLQRARVRGADRIRAAPRRAAARDALLPQRPVLRRQRDRRLRVCGARRLPVPQHALPAGRPASLAASMPASTRCRPRR